LWRESSIISCLLVRAKYGDLVGVELRLRVRTREGGMVGNLCEIKARISLSECASARFLVMGLIWITCEEGVEADLDEEVRNIGCLDR
jgi:hypothetical protein